MLSEIESEEDVGLREYVPFGGFADGFVGCL
jgi:hypothetical protein